MKLYKELASWFYLLTAPEDYAEEADFYANLLIDRADGPVKHVLELGCGGGNNASHMKKIFKMTLTDVSPEMLDQSRQLNPECRHVLGDMRSLRLNQTFDAVMVHDAVMYMTSESDLRAAMSTAVVHCRAGGVVLFVPDCVKETYHDYDHHGGHDAEDGRSLRYEEKVRDADPNDSTYLVEMCLNFRDQHGHSWTETDQHTFGLFSKQQWQQWLSEAGIETQIEALPAELTSETPDSFAILGVKTL